MHRNDNSNYFLYIEPSLQEKSLEPVNDIYTEAIEYFFNKSTRGCGWFSNLKSNGVDDFTVGFAYKGCHSCSDGEQSSNVDYLLENGFRYKLTGLNANTKYRFFVFVVNDKLSECLEKWKTISAEK
jgi:hypothetical protein